MTLFLAGMVPTADELNALVPQVYVCTSQLTKTSDTTMEDVPGLVFDVETGYIYYVVALIAYTGGATGDAKFDWSRTGAIENTDVRRFVIGLATGTTTNMSSSVAMPRRDADTDQAIGADGGAGSSSTSYIEHVIVIPSGAGTLSFRAAQNTSDSTPLQVTTQSRLVVTRTVAG